MSINRSEQFLYFQNKAKHYDNIKKVKPVVKDKLSQSLRNTINHSQSKTKSRLDPHLKRYQLDFDNQKMINRLMNIVDSKRKQIVVHGNYSRYHDVKRQFRTKNPYRDQVNRKIQLQNQQMVNRLGNVKPLIGNNSQWLNQYQQKINHRKNLSRYIDSQHSKGSLHISTQKFIPDHYRSLLDDEQLQKSKAGHTVAVVPKQKLISLPRILRKEQSKSVLEYSSNKTLDL